MGSPSTDQDDGQLELAAGRALVGRQRDPAWARAVALVVIGSAVVGSVGTVAAYAPDEATSTALGGLRLIGGAIVLSALVPWLGGSWRGMLALRRRWTIWAMGAGVASFQPLFFGAIERAGVAVSTLVTIGTVPVVAGLVGWAVMGSRPSGRWATATLVAVTGLALRSWGELRVGDWTGVAMAVGAGAGAGCYVVGSKVELDRGAAAAEITAAVYSIGAVLLVPLVLREPLGWIAEPAGIAVVVYLGVMTMAVGNLWVLVGMKHIAPGPGATLQLSDPLMATLLGVLLLGEALTVVGALGVVLVLVGLVLQARAPRPLRSAGHRTELLTALDEAIALLQAHDIATWANWLDQDRQRIAAGDDEALQHLLQAFGGMGSLNDLVLAPFETGEDGPASEAAARADEARLDALRTRIFVTATSMQRRGELVSPIDPPG
jgi:DME family drug/metabolite transporter